MGLIEFASVNRVNNPKSENYKKWYVSTSNSYCEQMKTVFMHEKKSVCVEHAKSIAKYVYVSNGIEYGCKW